MLNNSAFITQDEKSSGLIDADALGQGGFLFDVQVHAARRGVGRRQTVARSLRRSQGWRRHSHINDHLACLCRVVDRARSLASEPPFRTI